MTAPSVYCSESGNDDKLDLAIKQTFLEAHDKGDEIDELIKNLKIGASNHEEIAKAKDFFIDFVGGFPEAYQEKIKAMGQPLGLDSNVLCGFTFDILMSVDSVSYLNYIRILQTLPKELILEIQKQGLESYEQLENYDSSRYQELVLNLSSTNHDKLPSVIRELIEYSKSFGIDVQNKYCRCLKFAYIASGKLRAQIEGIDFEDLFEEIEREMYLDLISHLLETGATLNG